MVEIKKAIELVELEKDLRQLEQQKAQAQNNLIAISGAIQYLKGKITKLKEEQDATQEGDKPKDNQPKHQDGNKARQTS